MKKFLLSISIIVTVLAFLNPSMGRFKEYAAQSQNRHDEQEFNKPLNGLIFSIYTTQIVHRNRRDEILNKSEPVKYLGVFMNFFKLKSKEPPSTPAPSQYAN